MQIVPFDRALFKDAAEILSACSQNAERELAEYLENESAVLFCATEGKDTLGVIILLLTQDIADIADIAVSPAFKRRGIASALIERAVRLCREQSIPAIMLEVRKSNAAATALYEKCGFEKISQRKNYYSAPTEDALIYRREI